MALGTLGVRVMVERMVVRGSEQEVPLGEEEEGENGGAAEETEVDEGELRLDEEGEDLAVPLAWIWI